MKYALVKNGVVENIILADSGFAATLEGYDAVLDCNDSQQCHPSIAIGWVYDKTNGSTSPPVYAPINQLTWDNAPAEYWWLDIGTFFDRFGSKKLAILSSTDVLVQAIIMDVSVRKYVDLKRADVAQALTLIANKGLLTIQEAAIITTTHTTDYERHIKNLPQPV
jgi:hypothetical protein